MAVVGSIYDFVAKTLPILITVDLKSLSKISDLIKTSSIKVVQVITFRSKFTVYSWPKCFGGIYAEKEIDQIQPSYE
jgi:hypothetical protein